MSSRFPGSVTLVQEAVGVSCPPLFFGAKYKPVLAQKIQLITDGLLRECSIRSSTKGDLSATLDMFRPTFWAWFLRTILHARSSTCHSLAAPFSVG